MPARSSSRGNPRCPSCNGRGGSMVAGRWIKCECVRMTAERLRLQRLSSSAGARNPNRDAVRRVLRGEDD